MRKVLRGCVGLGILLVWCENVAPYARANPAGGTAAQGTATFTSSGPQLTITTSDRAFINWQSFNISAGETTTFVQPSSSSLVWNQIHDANPSQILGSLNANGYVVLQNQSGFYIGGQAAINTHGLLITTAPIQTPDLTGSSAWTFNAPAPSAKIVNYGQINIAGGGSAFLLASDIENNGTISAPGGKIGLYAGQQVLVSASPDGRALSARVTLPEGSVDNEGHLVADAGSIAMQARLVNQNGLVQANSARNINGIIELVASDKISLGANSTISASGDSTSGAVSPGGFVVLNSRNVFADTSASTIDVSGKSGGQDGVIEIFGAGVGAGTVQSAIGSHYALLFNPSDITLSSSATTGSPPSPNLYLADLSRYAQIDLQANHDITLSSSWTLADPGAGASLRLSAGNNVTLANNAAIVAANNWSVDLTAGTALAVATKPAAGQDGIYLNGNAYIQTQNGGVSLYAANEIILNSGGIRTLKGGSIDATAFNGDVNTGTSTSGFNYLSKAPYYTPFSVNIFGTISANSTLGGISTAGGGDVTINAGRNVTSYLPGQSDTGDPGTGAFGSQPGNVTINAVGNVYGHYVVVNGTGTINAGHNIGNASQNVALSLVKGGWNLNAPRGNIYLQETRNPNGVFNATGSYGSGGNHLFDYDPLAYADLNAGLGVYLTGQNLPRANGGVPMLLPPTLEVSAGAGGFNLQNPVALGGVALALSQPGIILFPSPDGNLQITTTDGGKFEGNGATLLMSDSGQTHWIPSDHTPPGPKPFSDNDHAAVPAELNNPDPVKITIVGSMENVTLKTSKATQITVGGDMINCSFYGQNLHPGDVTSIDVSGKISNPTSFTPFSLFQPIQNLPLSDLPPDTINNWQTALSLAVDPAKVANLDLSKVLPSQYSSLVNGLLLFGNALQTSFAYDPKTLALTFAGSMSPSVRNALDQPLTVLVYGPNGIPAVQKDPKTGQLHFKTDTFTWVASTTFQNPDGTGTTINPIDELYKNSQGVPALKDSAGGYIIGGPGVFNIQADSLSLGNTYGIISLGNGQLLGADYSHLTPYVRSGGATINVTVAGDLVMPASTIAALGGGNVNVTSTGGSMDLGSQYLVQFEAEIMKDNLGLGIYTSGGGNVNVSAMGTINIDSSRIATFNGGDIFIESFQGDVNAGSGGNVSIPVNVFSPLTALPSQPFEYVYANGIVAQTLVNAALVPDSAKFPGNITVKTPHGSIIANLGGILQEALNGNISAGPTITLVAGSDDYPNGNINLGDAGVIGGTVNVTASGTVSGLVISRQDSNVNAAQNFVGTVLSGGTANLSSGGTVTGTIIGATGVNASGAGGVSATLLGQNVSVNGGAAQSTLGTATATTTSQSAAGQASNDAKEQVASNATAEEDDSKKKKGKAPTLVRRSRVTVILPAKT